jgi:hypothetical protein
VIIVEKNYFGRRNFQFNDKNSLFLWLNGNKGREVLGEFPVLARLHIRMDDDVFE